MKERIFDGYGIEVFRDGETYSLIYDAGEIAARSEEIPISKVDAERASRSEQDAYEVIVAHQNTQRPTSN